MDLTNHEEYVRSFVQEYRQGNHDTKVLISREALETRRQVSTAFQGTNEAIERVGQDVGKLALNMDVQVDQAKRERLLQSLKYPGFNERRNEVRKAHTDTFQWVFAGDGEGSAESDSESDSTELNSETDSEINMIKWDSFSNWLKSTDTVYWINGKPGSGKSTLVKYILADPQTQLCLDIWSPGCLLISHYFWRPGSPMQHSLKGLFCSLLFQLLQKSETALLRVLESAAGSHIKGEVTDWSLEELQSTVLSTMEIYDRPICMFIDGLDELYPDQPTTLLDMIKKISVAGKTKMCLASRPEPTLQQRLHNMPQLRLQDLNAADLTCYVYDNIHASNFEDPDIYEKFVMSLVMRAEGVFLWLVLVTKSVRVGFDNRDSIDIIEERVNRLKGGDLESLYKDMWDRASKDDPDAYRRTAALYFRIMLLYNNRLDLELQIYGKNLSVFTMMLATTGFAEKTLKAAHQSHNLVPERRLLQGCKEVERIAETYCCGLIEVSERNDDGVIKDMVGWYRGKYDKLLIYAQARRALLFIHRTAVDFLVDTAQGQDILSYDRNTESSHAIQLVAANLAHTELFCDFTDRDTDRRWHFGVGSSASSHLCSVDMVRQAYTDADGSVSADCTRMMTHCKRLCDSEKIFADLDDSESCVCSGVNFFKAVAMYGWRCLDIFEDQIKALDRETLSTILRILCDQPDIFPDWVEVQRFGVDFLRLINLLLLEGADPNWHGTTAFAGSARDAWPYMCGWTPFVAFLSLTLMLAKSEERLAAFFKPHTQLPWSDSTNLLVTLQTFIRCGADLDAKVVIFFNEDDMPSTAQSPESGRYFHYRPFSPAGLLFCEQNDCFEDGYGYACSFLAHNILKLVLSEWEPLRRLSNAEKLFANITSSIAHPSTCRPRTINQDVLLRVQISGSSGWILCTASREHQDQIRKELMSLMNLSGRAVNTFETTSSADTQAVGYETLTSMLCGLHWVETWSGTFENVLEYFTELGVLASYSMSHDFHTVEEWLKLKGILDTT